MPVNDVEITSREAALADRVYEIGDESMGPRFRVGDLIGVDTKGVAEVGGLVVAEVDDTLVFRRYDGGANGRHTLTPLTINDRHRPIVREDVEFRGVLRWHRSVSLDGK